MALVCALFVYGYEITNFTLSIDEEFFDNYYQTITLGRWGHALLRSYILPEPFTPFFTIIFSVCLLALAATLSASIAKLDVYKTSLIAAVYVSIPQYAYQLEFANQSDTVSIGMVLCTLSVMAFHRGNNKLISVWALVSVCLYIYAIGIYQSLSILPISVMLSNIAFMSMRGEVNLNSSLKILSRYAVLSIISVAVYSFISKGFQFFAEVQPTSYFDQLIRWGNADFISTLVSLFSFISRYFTGKSFFGLNLYGLITIFYFVYLYEILRRRKVTLSKIIYPLIIIITPFIMNIAFGGSVPPRTMVSLGVCLSMIFGLSIYYIDNKLIPTVIVIIMVSIGSSSASKLFYSDKKTHEIDIRTAESIINTIYRKYPNFDPVKKPVYFYGGYFKVTPWKVKNSDVFGGSHFSWDGGNNKRIMSFMKMEGIAELRGIKSTDVEKARDAAQKLSLWPSPDSIVDNGDYIIVRLGKLPGKN
ncbi:glucosyltransferase domain-containing protein [Citrobacter sp. MAL-2]